jgi:hypothetical protein
MNILILTPDAVGSTLLQRLITIYMQFHRFDRPVINLHELTNGLELYWSERLGQSVLGKPQNRDNWGYFQSLKEIVDLLESANHYKTSRLAQYHIVSRQDSTPDQTAFYQYLNDNFLIISCQRRNLLEHALSWAINKITKRLNVYTHDEKMAAFGALYKDPINIDPQSMIDSLNQYKDYLKWVQTNFSVSNYFQYERDLPNIEQFILDLPPFTGQSRRTWKSMFNLEFSDYNRCHYLATDPAQLRLEATSEQDYQLPEYNVITLNQFHTEYTKTCHYLDRMVEQRLMITPPPIKKQTLLEKIYIIRNFQTCLERYNHWAADNSDIADPITVADLQSEVLEEMKYWRPNSGDLLSLDQIITQIEK